MWHWERPAATLESQFRCFLSSLFVWLYVCVIACVCLSGSPMTILSRPNSIVSDCSSLGQLDDVTPFTSFEADPLNLGFQTKQCSFGSLNVNSLLGQDRLHQICLPPLLNHRYPTDRTFEHYPFMSNFLLIHSIPTQSSNGTNLILS